MKVARWGNSLAVRIPGSIARSMGIKEGDEIEFARQDEGQIELRKPWSPEAALARMHAMRRPLPEGWKFNRDEANER